MADSSAEKDIVTTPPALSLLAEGTQTSSAKANGNRNVESGHDVFRPAGWMYKTIKLGGIRLPWYASPPTQLLLVGIVCFLCPGMFNAVNGLGGGGQLDPVVADNSNVAVYSTFSIVGFFAGSVVNRMGIKLTLSFGGLGYCLYVASYLSYNHNANAGFVIFAGAMLGVCAAMLWSAQGAIMMSFPCAHNIMFVLSSLLISFPQT